MHGWDLKHRGTDPPLPQRLERELSRGYTYTSTKRCSDLLGCAWRWPSPCFRSKRQCGDLGAITSIVQWLIILLVTNTKLSKRFEADPIRHPDLVLLPPPSSPVHSKHALSPHTKQTAQPVRPFRHHDPAQFINLNPRARAWQVSSNMLALPMAVPPVPPFRSRQIRASSVLISPSTSTYVSRLARRRTIVVAPSGAVPWPGVGAHVRGRQGGIISRRHGAKARTPLKKKKRP